MAEVRNRWQPNVYYPKGTIVSWDNAFYECQVDHASMGGYPPGVSTAWKWTDKAPEG